MEWSHYLVKMREGALFPAVLPGGTLPGQDAELSWPVLTFIVKAEESEKCIFFLINDFIDLYSKCVPASWSPSQNSSPFHLPNRL